MKLQLSDSSAFSLDTTSVQAPGSNILRIAFASQAKQRTQYISEQTSRRNWDPDWEMVAYVTLELCAVAVVALAASALSS